MVIGFAETASTAHLFWEYVGHSAETAGPSMLSTLNVVGDFVWVNKRYRRGKGISVGDVVSVKHPWFPETRASKRVLGMPGDFVLRDTPGKGSAMIQVPEGHCWLAGDNLSESRDSRDYGPLPLALIRGKVTARVLPWSERKWLKNPLEPVTR
ncbi:hypothetical protein MMC30_006177 [Trapelia coarctata]|nr:hypothetical protein [Trapelia coarctata]